jgi:phosphomannomutase
MMALSKQQGKMSDVLRPLRRYWNSGEINSAVEDQARAIAALAAACPGGTHDTSDGLTVDFPDWWFNARGSNTEPLLRLNVEARDPEFGPVKTAELLQVIRDSQNGARNQ